MLSGCALRRCMSPHEPPRYSYANTLPSVLQQAVLVQGVILPPSVYRHKHNPTWPTGNCDANLTHWHTDTRSTAYGGFRHRSRLVEWIAPRRPWPSPGLPRDCRSATHLAGAAPIHRHWRFDVMQPRPAAPPEIASSQLRHRPLFTRERRGLASAAQNAVGAPPAIVRPRPA
jgi:hypothetical protein